MIAELDDLPASTVFAPDVAIIGGGAAGITLALELTGSGASVMLFEGGGRAPSVRSQARYEGDLELGPDFDYPPLDVWRLRYFGGTTNHWGGWYRPLEANVFEPRPGRSEVGWPFTRSELSEEYERAHELCHLGRQAYDAATLCAETGHAYPITSTDTLATPVWRFSPPTRFGQEYAERLEASDHEIYLGANLVALEVSGRSVSMAHLRGDDGRRYTVRPGILVLACGGLENLQHLLTAQRFEAPELNRSGTLGLGFSDHPHVPVGFQLVDRSLLEGDGLLPMTGFPRDVDGTEFKIGVGITDEVLAQRSMMNVSYSFYDESDAIESQPFGRAVQALWKSALGAETGAISLYARTELRHDPARRVRLSTRMDDLGVPRLSVDLPFTAVDRRDIDDGWEIVVRELMKQGFGPAVKGRSGALGSSITGGGHHLGGARVHKSAEVGVVDPWQRCHALDNVYVAGSAEVSPS